jgi:hypothetical protein
VDPGALEPLEAMEELVFLRHNLCVILSEEWLTAPPHGVAPGSPRASMAQGMSSCT